MKKSLLMIALVMLAGFTSLTSAQSIANSLERSSLEAKVVFKAEPITTETSTGTLFGTLELPQSTAPVPVVLIIAGSGPTDRDGNSPVFKGPNNSLRMLAEGLAALGIASVRYDKRGIGETGKAMLLAAQRSGSMPSETDLSFENYIDDAVSWCRKLQADRRFSTLIVVGHSEGSLIGMVAAQKARADAFVSIAGSSRPAHDLLLDQLKTQLPAELLVSTRDILNQLAAGKTFEKVPSELNVIFRPSVQPYLISWFRYLPVKEIARLPIPVLVAQGTTDIQTSLQDARMLTEGNPAARLLVIEGMNHVFKTVPNDKDKQVSSYGDPTLPVVPELITRIAGFVVERKPNLGH